MLQQCVDVLKKITAAIHTTAKTELGDKLKTRI
jgi:hypothetical protein